MALFSENLSSLFGPVGAPLLIGTAVLLLATWTVFSTTRQYLRLRHIKGPATAGFSKWWLIRAVTGGRTHLDLYETCQTYGDIARVGPNELVTNDPGLIKHMLNVRTHYKRSDWYYAMRFDPSRDNVLSILDDGRHSKLRSKMAHGYSGKEVENLESTIDKNVQALVGLIQTYVSAKKAFDFGRKAQFFTLDVISHLAFGDAFGFIASDKDVYDYCKIFEEQMPSIIFTTIYPWLVDVLQWPLVRNAVPSDKDPLGFGKVMGIARNVAAQRYAPTAKQQKDMLGSFMAHGLTEEEAKSEILLQILAGSDTTAASVRATMLYIITNPRIVTALLRELTAAGLGPDTTLSSSDPVISDSQARSLPYLQAVIKEGLRVHPTVVGLQSKEVPAAGDVWNGVRLPGGTHVGVCYWGLMRRPDVWGDDAAEFRPERWLESPPEKLRAMEDAWELVFGYGRWQCLGRNVALMELNKVFVELLRRFEFCLIDPTNPWRSINAGVFIQREFWIRAYKRE